MTIIHLFYRKVTQLDNQHVCGNGEACKACFKGIQEFLITVTQCFLLFPQQLRASHPTPTCMAFLFVRPENTASNLFTSWLREKMIMFSLHPGMQVGKRMRLSRPQAKATKHKSLWPEGTTRLASAQEALT